MMVNRHFLLFLGVLYKMENFINGHLVVNVIFTFVKNKLFYSECLKMGVCFIFSRDNRAANHQQVNSTTQHMYSNTHQGFIFTPKQNIDKATKSYNPAWTRCTNHICLLVRRGGGGGAEDEYTYCSDCDVSIFMSLNCK